ncbi:MAG: tyrosine-type recombinase/integrase [Oligoflexales bacterium]
MFNFKKHSDYLEGWNNAMANGLMDGRPFSPHTQKSYNYYVTDFLNRYGKVSYEHLKTELARIPVRQYSKRDSVYRGIVCFAKYLEEERTLEKGFLEQAKRIRPKRHLPPKRTTVKYEDVLKLLAVCKNPLDRFIILFLVSTGFRASEACSLTLKDINREEKKVYLPKGKWGKSRQVGLSEEVMTALDEYMAWRGPVSSNDLLLVNGVNLPIERNGLFKRLQKLGRRAGVEVSPHALRRAFVTINVSNGLPLVYLQIACGHSDIKTTRDYCQVTEEEVAEAMKSRFTSFSSSPQHPAHSSGHTSS